MIKHIIKGIQGYFNSLSLINKLKLWKYFFVPIIISALTATLIGFLAYGLSDNIGHFIAKIWIWEIGKETFTSFSTILGVIFVLAIGLVLYKHIIMAFSAPFMSPVSEKIEAYLSKDLCHQHRKTNFSEQLARGIRLNMRNLIKELLITIPLLFLKFIPGVNVFSTISLFLTQSYYAGFGNMDYTLERHYNYRDSVKFVNNHKGLAIGNGAIFMLFLLIPVIGVILVLPFSVTAASIKTIEIINKEKGLHQHQNTLV
jgi:CysZ protein|tara:strand:+ start:106 stop:876 length:771 start_codon:yes stop_codon:yes gene_type:complete